MDGEGDPNPLAVLSPPHWVINDEDHGGYVIIATWTMMCYMVMIVIVRLMRKFLMGAWSLDDNLICIATISGLVQDAMLHKAVVAGLGKHQADLSPASLDTFYRYSYAYQILFITSTCFSKLSLLAFIYRLIPNSKTTRGAQILAGVSVVWGVGTVFGVVFQCAVPSPWNITSGTCSNVEALYYSVAIINLVTDLAITLLPLSTLWNVQMERGPRLTVMAVFVVRLGVCFTEIPRLVYLTRFLESSDKTWSAVDLSIWTQAVTNLSIATACIPCLKPFLSSMRSGVFNTALPAGFEGGLQYTLESSGNGRIPSNSLNRDFFGSKKQNTISTIIESSDKTTKIREQD